MLRFTLFFGALLWAAAAGAQIKALEDGKDLALKAAVEEFRADEAAHRDTALAEGAEQAPGYRLLSETIKAGCRIAIKLSERI